MTDIASNVERIIDKLDGMTTEIVPKTYGTDIASKVEHIAKQLDYVQAGGGEGGSSGGAAPEYVHVSYENGKGYVLTDDITYNELMAMCKAGKCLGIIRVFEDSSSGNEEGLIFPLVKYDESEQKIRFEYTYVEVGSDNKTRLQVGTFVHDINGITFNNTQYIIE